MACSSDRPGATAAASLVIEELYRPSSALGSLAWPEDGAAPGQPRAWAELLDQPGDAGAQRDAGNVPEAADLRDVGDEPVRVVEDLGQLVHPGGPARHLRNAVREPPPGDLRAGPPVEDLPRL